ncbi:hypothetical protein ACROYT_G021627 [Oculina patagonica]
MKVFDYTIEYKPGSENIADFLSRLSCGHIQEEEKKRNIAEEYVRFVAQTATPKVMTTRDIEEHSHHDAELCEVTPLWAQANGEVERQNRSLLNCTRIAPAEGKNLRKELVRFLAAYRTTPHTVTGVCPAELLFGRKIRTKLPEFCETAVNDEELRDRAWEKKMTAKTYADARRGAQLNDLQAGDQVLLKTKKSNKLSANFESEPYEIVEKRATAL